MPMHELARNATRKSDVSRVAAQMEKKRSVMLCMFIFIVLYHQSDFYNFEIA